MCYCNCNNDIVKTHVYSKNPDYRVIVKPDYDAIEPDWDMQWPLFELTGYEVKPVNKEAKEFLCWGLNAAYREFDHDVFERYLRIFHGVTTVAQIDTRDSTFIMFDPQELATVYQCKDRFREDSVNGEASVWQDYFNGDVYGIILQEWQGDDEDDRDDDGYWGDLDSVWGFYGWDVVSDDELDARAEEMGAE